MTIVKISSKTIIETKMLEPNHLQRLNLRGNYILETFCMILGVMCGNLYALFQYTELLYPF